MRASEIMTKEPATCAAETTLDEAAKMMLRNDCGCLPVCDGLRVVGVITDRDIAVRAVAASKSPSGSRVSDFMSHPVVTVNDETELEECCRVMEENQIRRIPVVTNQGICCGMISQADIARSLQPEIGELLRAISQPAA